MLVPLKVDTFPSLIIKQIQMFFSFPPGIGCGKAGLKLIVIKNQIDNDKRPYKIFNVHCFRNATVLAVIRIHFFVYQFKNEDEKKGEEIE